MTYTLVDQARQQISMLSVEKANLEAALKKALSDKNDEVQAAAKRNIELHEEIKTIQAARAKTETRLKKKLEVGPNSWAEITFHCKGFKDRKYVFRMSTTPEVARVELRKAIQKADAAYTYVLKVKGKEVSWLYQSLSMVSSCSIAVGRRPY